MLEFHEEGHLYQDPENKDVKWTSVTSLVGKFKNPFDKEAIAEKCSANASSKWYGLSKEEILNIWDQENKRAVTVGNWYHNQRESDVIELETLSRNGKSLEIFAPNVELINDKMVKYAPSQKLQEGVYPELLVYSNSYKICGQADLVAIVNGKIHILDYKTNKSIDKSSYVDRRTGKSKRLLPPLSHLDDCNYNHYNLQLSIYAYMIKLQNPKLRIGSLIIQHVEFEVEDKDEYGYPIMKMKGDDYVVKSTKQYKLPYLEKEVKAILKDFKQSKK